MNSIGRKMPAPSALAIEPHVTPRAQASDGAPPVAPALPSEPSAFARVLANMGKALERGEHVNASIKSAQGRNLDAAELLALQSDVYRYSQTVDLTSKLVDGGSHSVKTVLQGGGQ